MEEICRQIINKAYQLRRSQIGKHDFLVVHINCDNSSIREVILNEPHPDDLKPG